MPSKDSNPEKNKEIEHTKKIYAQFLKNNKKSFTIPSISKSKLKKKEFEIPLKKSTKFSSKIAIKMKEEPVYDNDNDNDNEDDDDEHLLIHRPPIVLPSSFVDRYHIFSNPAKPRNEEPDFYDYKNVKDKGKADGKKIERKLDDFSEESEPLIFSRRLSVKQKPGNELGEDGENGEDAEQVEESTPAMDVENEGGCSSAEVSASSGSNKKLKRDRIAVENVGRRSNEEASTSSGLNKKLKIDRLADAMASIAESFRQYMINTQAILQPPRLSGKEIHSVVALVPGIPSHQILRAVKRFMSRPDEFQMLKDLPDDRKLEWVLVCLAD